MLGVLLQVRYNLCRFGCVLIRYRTATGLKIALASASVIGPPLYADDMTSKLEILPFAKICVQYSIGDDLPTAIPVTVMNPVSGEKMVEEVLVSYPNKPLACTACKALGHLIGACPTVTRKWVRKERPPVQDNVVQPSIPAPDATMETAKPNVTAISSQKIITSTPEKTTATDDCLDDSATPVKPFKNLRKVDEIDAKQASTTSEEPPFIPSKSQRKRLKKAQGKSSPSPHH